MKDEPYITDPLSLVKSGGASSSSGTSTGLKMKAFSLSSSSRKPVSKLEIEKQKKLEAEAEAAKAYEEFVATFDQESPALVPKTFIKGSVINPGTGGTNCHYPLLLESTSSRVRVLMNSSVMF